MVPAVAAPGQPGAHFRVAHQRIEQRRAGEEVRLVVAMHLGMEAHQAREQRGSGAGVTEDEELLHRKELPGLGNFFGVMGGTISRGAFSGGAPLMRILAASLKRLVKSIGVYYSYLAQIYYARPARYWPVRLPALPSV